MAEQLGIEWHHDDRIEVDVAEALQLFAARREKMLGVRVRGALRPGAIVELLLCLRTSRPVMR